MNPLNRSKKLLSPKSSWSRRQFLAAGSAALLPLTSPRTLASPHHRIPEFQRPLPIPEVLSPVRRDATTDYYEIVKKERSVEILPGRHTRIWGYNGSFPGPTIEAQRGRATVVTYTNRLDVPTVAHLHGGVTRPESDGFPTDTVAPGESRRCQYDNTGRAATLWYHDHSVLGAGRNLYMGLAGLYLSQVHTAVAPQDLKWCQMGMHGMQHGLSHESAIGSGVEGHRRDRGRRRG